MASFLRDLLRGRSCWVVERDCEARNVVYRSHGPFETRLVAEKLAADLARATKHANVLIEDECPTP